MKLSLNCLLKLNMNNKSNSIRKEETKQKFCAKMMPIIKLQKPVHQCEKHDPKNNPVLIRMMNKFKKHRIEKEKNDKNENEEEENQTSIFNLPVIHLDCSTLTTQFITSFRPGKNPVFQRMKNHS